MSQWCTKAYIWHTGPSNGMACCSLFPPQRTGSKRNGYVQVGYPSWDLETSLALIIGPVIFAWFWIQHKEGGSTTHSRSHDGDPSWHFATDTRTASDVRSSYRWCPFWQPSCAYIRTRLIPSEILNGLWVIVVLSFPNLSNCEFLPPRPLDKHSKARTYGALPCTSPKIRNSS